MWQGKPAQLALNFDNGFTLLEAPSGSMGREMKVLWSFPFERLRTSADDGSRLLWLDFGGDEGEMVSCC